MNVSHQWSVYPILCRGGGAGGGGGGGGGGEGGAGGGGAIPTMYALGGGLAPPKMTDGIYQSETRWQKRYLAYSSEMAIATIYTHSKLAQLKLLATPILT